MTDTKHSPEMALAGARTSSDHSPRITCSVLTILLCSPKPLLPISNSSCATDTKLGTMGQTSVLATRFRGQVCFYLYTPYFSPVNEALVRFQLLAFRKLQ